MLDKPKVSIKINGIKRSFYETTPDKDNQLKNTEDDKKKYGIEHKPVYDKPSFAKEEVAAANEEGEFEWVLPKPSQYYREERRKPIMSMGELRQNSNPPNNSIYVSSKQKNNNPFPFKTFLLAIISALVIGTSFGLMVLHLFTDNQQIPTSGTNQPIEVGTTDETDRKEDPVGNADSVTIATVSELSVFLVQGGVYSTADAVTPILEQMKGKGLAGIVLNQEGKYYLFLGIGSSDQAAKTIRTSFEADIEGAFVKNLITPEQKGNPSILQAKQLFDQLVSYTTSLHLSTPESINWDEVKKTNKALIGTDSDSAGDIFIKSIKNAYGKVEVYKSSLTNQDFWATQQALLNSYQLYQNWIFEQ